MNVKLRKDLFNKFWYNFEYINSDKNKFWYNKTQLIDPFEKNMLFHE